MNKQCCVLTVPHMLLTGRLKVCLQEIVKCYEIFDYIDCTDTQCIL